MSNPFLDAQTAMRDRLAASPVFKDGANVLIPLTTEDPKDPSAEVLMQLYRYGFVSNSAGKAGIAVAVLTLTGQRAEDSRTALFHGLLTQRIWIRENLAMNRDAVAGIGVGAWDVLWAVLGQLQGWSPGKGNQVLQFDAFATDLDPERTVLDLFVDFGWNRSFSPPLSQPPKP